MQDARASFQTTGEGRVAVKEFVNIYDELVCHLSKVRACMLFWFVLMKLRIAGKLPRLCIGARQGNTRRANRCMLCLVMPRPVC